MNNLQFYRVDKDDFDYFLQSSDLVMCKRNFYSAYNDFFVLLSPKGHLEAACVIQIIDDNNFYIKLFEVSEMNFRQGIGRLLFNKIIEFYSNNVDPITFELESLDDDSTGFWKHLGFTEFENEEGETRMRKIIEF
jgi:hypothetical protein